MTLFLPNKMAQSCTKQTDRALNVQSPLLMKNKVYSGPDSLELYTQMKSIRAMKTHVAIVVE